ncbi:glucoamylase family protein [Tunturiibacter lichenicola]|uniref:glucoamylase family protein n=1 Tax=Tunturiibacter lichenicola TaxID=2051959 RepID=UPI0021B4B787|nr:glucoamylase family protein [Edaphobacter lichenicola]
MSFSPSAPPKITRRRATKLLGGAIATGLIAPPLFAQQPATAPPTYSRLLSDEDLAFLEEMERAGCLYFTEQADPASGQVLDRATNKTSTGELDTHFASSIAATGFGLTALCISDKRGFLPADRIKKQVIATLDFHLNKMPNEHGFFYHFNDIKTGKPLINVEVSSIDTAILLCGVLTARAYFNDPKITALATQLYNRVDFPWMLNGGKTFSMGWRPETGFIATRWDHYSELMMLYLLAIGSPTHPISPDSWNAFTRPPMTFGPYSFISGRDPLFIHQYSHAWFDFARQRDAYADYFANSITATRAHKAFCLGLKRGYTDDYWGVSASDWQHGYTAWGGPPLMGPVDGSVVPCAAAGSLPFLPRECVRVLRALRDNFGADAWGRYGFCDAFHPDLHWFDPDVLGIDLGIGVLMAENLRTAFVWDTFMQNPEPVAAMKACGFHSSRQVNPPTQNTGPVSSPNQQPVTPSTNRPPNL